MLAARWRKARRRGPKLVAVTVDHGLRPEAKREATAVKRLARSLGVAHRTLRWTGRKPSTGLQAAARAARYRLLAAAARRAGARHVLTAHTLDDQAETVLIRLARGSGLGGLAAMARVSPLPAGEATDILLVRPLLGRAQVPAGRDLAQRRHRLCRRSDQPRSALHPGPAAGGDAGAATRGPGAAAAGAAGAPGAAGRGGAGGRGRAGGGRACAPSRGPQRGPIAFPAGRYAELPAEVALRLLGRAIAWAGNEGPVELGKLEALYAALTGAPGGVRFRRTLAGALITRGGGRLSVERAPPRRRAASKRP